MSLDIGKILSLLYDVRSEYTSQIDAEQEDFAPVLLEQCMNCLHTGDSIDHDEGCMFQKIEEVIRELESLQENFE